MGNCDNWRSTVVVVVIVVVAAVVEGHDDGVAGMVGVGATKAKLFQIGSHLSLSHLSLSAQFHMHYSITSHGHFTEFLAVHNSSIGDLVRPLVSFGWSSTSKGLSTYYVSRWRGGEGVSQK